MHKQLNRYLYDVLNRLRYHQNNYACIDWPNTNADTKIGATLYKSNEVISYSSQS